MHTVLQRMVALVKKERGSRRLQRQHSLPDVKRGLSWRSQRLERLEERTLLSIGPALEPFLEVNPNVDRSPFAPVQIQESMAPEQWSHEFTTPEQRRMDSAPSSYDLRDVSGTDYVTPVKDQGSLGSCWTFATYGSLESTILKDGGLARDFSENDLSNNHGFDNAPNDGGNIYMSEAHLSRWDGPVDQLDDPYYDYDDSPSPGGSPQYYVGNSVHLDTAAEMKDALMAYGAMYTSMRWESAYFNSSNNTYYYSGAEDPNHGVTVVGWDDNMVTDAPTDGAWLIKNSQWGTTSGDGGYFWLSYADTKGGKYGHVYHDPVDAGTYSQVYYHDEFGNVNTLSSPYAFNAFTANASEDLTAVQFWTNADEASYDVRIYDTFSGGSLSSLLGSMTGSFTYAGMHTVDLPSPVSLTNGDDFYVYLHITAGGTYPQAIDYAYPGYSSSSTASAGESYYSFNGTSWTDLTGWDSTANFCIKALTRSSAGEISVKGNDVNIVDGDTTPRDSEYAAADFTDFGHAGISGQTVDHTFTIFNNGGGTLTLTGGSPVSISGAHSGDYSVTQPSTTTLASGASTTFQVRFDPSAVGTRTATVNIASNDADEGTFSFDIQGKGHTYPTIFVDGFESGSVNNWTTGGSGTTPYVEFDAFLENDMLPHSGSYVAYLGDLDNGTYATSTMDYVVDLSGYTAAELDFSWATYSLVSGKYIRLDIYDGSWHNNVNSWAYIGTSWQDRTLDLSSYNLVSGFTIRFQSYMNSREYSDAAYVDDVVLTGYSGDTAEPTVVSVERDDPNPTNAASVDYTVTFSEDVSGLDASDFSLTTTGGLSGASVTAVTPASGFNTVYTVTVSTGTGDGTIRLDVDDDTVTDRAGNLLDTAYSAGQVYTIDKTAPVTLIDFPVQDAFYNQATWTDWITGTASDTGGAAVAAVQLSLQQGSGNYWDGDSFDSSSEYFWTANGTTDWSTAFTDSNFPADGTYTVHARATDTAGNVENSPTATFTFDTAEPTVVSVERDDPDPTNAASVDYTVTFSEDVTGLDASDFSLTTTGGLSGASVTAVTPASGFNTVYTVTVSTGTGDGTIRLDVDDDTVTDRAGNLLDTAYSAGQVYTIDKTAPVTHITFPVQDAFYNQATWTDWITGTASDTGGAAVAAVQLSLQQGSGNYWDGDSFDSSSEYFWTANGTTDWSTAFTDSNFPADGTYTVHARASDTAGNLENSPTATFTFDTAEPTVVSVERDDPDPTNAASVDYTVTFSEDVTGLDTDDFTLTTGGLSGASVTAVTPASGFNTVYTVTVSTGTGDGTIRLDVNDDDTVTDRAANLLDTAYSAGQVYTIDKTAPVTHITFPVQDAFYNQATWTDWITGTASDTGGAAVAAVQLSLQQGSGNYWDGDSFDSSSEYFWTANGTTDWSTAFTDSNFPADGTYTVHARASDTAGNLENSPTATFTFDTAEPTVVSVERDDPDPTNAASVDYTVTFSEDVTGVDTDDFTLTTGGLSGASVTAVTPASGFNTVYTVTVSTGIGDGTIRLDVNDDDTVTDRAANLLDTPYSAGQVYRVDHPPGRQRRRHGHRPGGQPARHALLRRASLHHR